MSPGLIILPSLPNHLDRGEATLAFTRQNVEDGQKHNHFQIVATDKVPPRYNKWRMMHMANIKVKVGGYKKDMSDVLKEMEGDIIRDGTWGS